MTPEQQKTGTLVREWANFHPDIPLTKRYTDLVQRISELLKQSQGCEHCSCTCNSCTACGPKRTDL